MARAKRRNQPKERQSALESATDRSAFFGRLSASPKGAMLTALSCPDCAGVLMFRRVGKHGFISFDCQVGHRYSSIELLEAKEASAENALWQAIELFEELEVLHLGLSVRAKEAGTPDTGHIAAVLQQRAARAAELVARLRAALERDLPADFRPDDSLGV